MLAYCHYNFKEACVHDMYVCVHDIYKHERVLRPIYLGVSQSTPFGIRASGPAGLATQQEEGQLRHF